MAYVISEPTTLEQILASLLAEQKKNHEESCARAEAADAAKKATLREMALEIMKDAIYEGPLDAGEIAAVLGQWDVYETTLDYLTVTAISSGVLPGLSIQKARGAHFPKIVCEYQEAWLGKAGQDERGRALDVIAYANTMHESQKAIEAREAEDAKRRALVDDLRARGLTSKPIESPFQMVGRLLHELDQRVSALEADARDQAAMRVEGYNL